MSATAGFHIPSIPLSDVVGNVGTVPPSQITSEGPKPNSGVMVVVTVTDKLVVVAHCPVAGVNV